MCTSVNFTAECYYYSGAHITLLNTTCSNAPEYIIIPRCAQHRWCTFNLITSPVCRNGNTKYNNTAQVPIYSYCVPEHNIILLEQCATRGSVTIRSKCLHNRYCSSTRYVYQNLWYVSCWCPITFCVSKRNVF